MELPDNCIKEDRPQSLTSIKLSRTFESQKVRFFHQKFVSNKSHLSDYNLKLLRFLVLTQLYPQYWLNTTFLRHTVHQKKMNKFLILERKRIIDYKEKLKADKQTVACEEAEIFNYINN